MTGAFYDADEQFCYVFRMFGPFITKRFLLWLHNPISPALLTAELRVFSCQIFKGRNGTAASFYMSLFFRFSPLIIIPPLRHTHIYNCPVKREVALSWQRINTSSFFKLGASSLRHRLGCLQPKEAGFFNTQNYCVFGLFPSSGILENRKHDVSETGSVSVLRWGPLERANLNHWTSSDWD
jgi:hypothetical protein